ncbi:MAG TPA: flavin reductase family protein [Dehalococcoidia bacterium]|nr:flavin reductase family protein [Dehalococcoidia bacterium]
MDEAAKKTALRMIPYGLFVMTVKDGDKMTGAAVNWLTQASFQPPLVVLGAKADAPSTGMIERSGLFNINVMETGQTAIASAFFKHVEPDGNKFGDIEFTLSPNGLPVLKDALAWFECRVREKVAIGDHTIFVGEVIEAGVQREGEPLTLAETGFKYGG